MLLNSKFNIARGWKEQGCIEENFVPATGVTLPRGTIVSQHATTGVVNVVAALPSVPTASGLIVWMVAEGNDDLSSQAVGKVVCIRGPAMVQLDPSNITAGTYNVGTLITYHTDGKIKPAAAGGQVIGSVIENNVALDGTLTILFEPTLAGFTA